MNECPVCGMDTGFDPYYHDGVITLYECCENCGWRQYSHTEKQLPLDQSEKARLQRFQASGSDAPAPVPEYERGD